MNSERAIELAERLLQGSKRALARLITHVENAEPGVDAALSLLYKHTGKAHLVGITGPPGAGKSTLTDKLIQEGRAIKKKVGVICVDPSSPFSGGAILGDRIRMQRHSEDANVFIRSVGTRGGQGGLSRNTQEAAMLLDAAGYDLIILETAGVGQTELGILEVAQTILLVLVPESGDDIQMMKAGILEIANVLAVNKCDRAGADHIVKELKTMLEYGDQKKQWEIPVLKTIAEQSSGVHETFLALQRHKEFLNSSGKIQVKNRYFAEAAIKNIVRDLSAQYVTSLVSKKDGLKILDDVSSRRLDPYSAARILLKGDAT